MPSRIKLIIDFDGTLVLENSSRVFQAAVLEYRSGAARMLISTMYFGPFSRLLDKVWAALTLFVFRGGDVRLWTFVFLSRKVIAENLDALIKKTAAELSLNAEVMARVRQADGSVTILSCGLGPVIVEFLKLKHIAGEVGVASQLEAAGDNAQVKIVAPRHKAEFLHYDSESHDALIYLTDDLREAHHLARSENGAGMVGVTEMDGRQIYSINII